MMVDLVTKIGEYLLADVSIAALVGNRFFPLRLPQKVAMPAITAFEIMNNPDVHLRGWGALGDITYQVDAWAPNVAQAHILGALIRVRLGGFQSEWSDDESPPHETRVWLFPGDARDLFEEEILGGLVRRSADYRLMHTNVPVTT